jgi:twitching motility two-component system response regulator PilH
MARILIVDDSPTDVHVVKGMLEGSGYEVEAVDNPTDALSIAHERPPDLILMDVVFEGMSGFQATRKLAKDPNTAPIPIIIISVKDQESDRIWGLRQGAVEYLVKPVKPKQLLDTVQTVLKTRGIT